MIQQAHRMFDEMKNAAIARLAGRTPEDIAEKARVPFDGTTFLLDTLGMHIRVQYPEYHMTPQLHDWHTLAVLHYLGSCRRHATDREVDELFPAKRRHGSRRWV